MLKSIIKVKTQDILKLDKKKIINYLENDKIVIIKKIISKKLCNSILKYLTNISHNNITNYLNAFVAKKWRMIYIVKQKHYKMKHEKCSTNTI